MITISWVFLLIDVASFTMEVNPRLAKRLLKTNRCLTNCELTSLVKEATGVGYHIDKLSRLYLPCLNRIHSNGALPT